MKILFTLGSWHPAHGGPFFSVGNLAMALSRSGHEVHLLAGDYPHMPAQAAPEGVRLHLIKGRLLPAIRQTLLPGANKCIDAIIQEVQPDVIHDNGLWLTLNHKVGLAAQRHNIPHILSPRGTLDPWAMQYRNLKKRIALALYQRRDLVSVTRFHAASLLEAKNIKAFGLTQATAVVPNGVDIPEQPARFNIDGSQTPRLALFIGRMHPVKNLPTLLEAWAQLRPDGWHLQLVGASEVGHRQVLESLAQKLGISKVVTFSDPVYGEAKNALLRNAQLGFLVSKSENFGIAAAEAMAAGVPVIASRTVPWKCLQDDDLGWWVEGDVSGISAAIREACNLSPQELQQKGLRARAYAQAEFGWQSIAEKFTEQYQQMIASY